MLFQIFVCTKAALKRSCTTSAGAVLRVKIFTVTVRANGELIKLQNTLTGHAFWYGYPVSDSFYQRGLAAHFCAFGKLSLRPTILLKVPSRFVSFTKYPTLTNWNLSPGVASSRDGSTFAHSIFVTELLLR